MSEISFFLDCGAYSADSQGKSVDLEEYIAYIKQHEHLLDIYPVLDVIGNAEETWKNQQIMENAGLKPLPVFHVEDNMNYLFQCLEYEYFCLGGMAGGAGGKTRQAFLNKCFDIICDTPDKTPKCKVHGFGLASPSLMMQYPFYSVDTSSWVAYSQYGIILVPKFDNYGKPLYGKTPNKIFVTERSPRMQQEGMHYQNVTGIEKAFIDDYIQFLGFQMGKSSTFDCDRDYTLQETETFINKEKTRVERAEICGISNNNSMRYAYNMRYFQAIADSCPEWPWSWSPKIRSFF